MPARAPITGNRLRTDAMPEDHPVDYIFLSHPTTEQVHQIKALYVAEGWWQQGDDKPGLVPGIVAGSHAFLVAVGGGEIIGMGRCISDGVSDAYVQDVTVKADCRHAGIGTRIIEDLVARLQQDNLNWIGLIAEKNSDRFYRRLGFRSMPESVPMLKMTP